jgi:hypothetical protein
MTKKNLISRCRKNLKRKTVRSKKIGIKKVSKGGAVEDVLEDNKYEEFNGEFKRIFKGKNTINDDMIKELFSFVQQTRFEVLLKKMKSKYYPKLKDTVDTIFESFDMTVDFIKNDRNEQCELTDNIEECLRLFVIENACKILADKGYTDETIQNKLSDSSVGSSVFSSHCHVTIPIKDKFNKSISFDDIDEIHIINEDDENYDFDDSDGRQEMKKRNICLQFSFNPLEYDTIYEYHQKSIVFSKC